MQDIGIITQMGSLTWSHRAAILAPDLKALPASV